MKHALMQNLENMKMCFNDLLINNIDCGYDIEQRNGKYGGFWSCSYHRTGGPSCGHKEQVVAPIVIL